MTSERVTWQHGRYFKLRIDRRLIHSVDGGAIFVSKDVFVWNSIILKYCRSWWLSREKSGSAVRVESFISCKGEECTNWLGTSSCSTRWFDDWVISPVVCSIEGWGILQGVGEVVPSSSCKLVGLYSPCWSRGRGATGFVVWARDGEDGINGDCPDKTVLFPPFLNKVITWPVFIFFFKFSIFWRTLNSLS